MYFKCDKNYILPPITFLIRRMQLLRFFLYFLQSSRVKFQNLPEKTQLELLGAGLGTQLLWNLSFKEKK